MAAGQLSLTALRVSTAHSQLYTVLQHGVCSEMGGDSHVPTGAGAAITLFVAPSDLEHREVTQTPGWPQTSAWAPIVS